MSGTDNKNILFLSINNYSMKPILELFLSILYQMYF